ncbi:NAD-dependent epimerase/dehydratase family protein [Ornithinimicrobium pratense]|uniref:Oxidoreductase n=1 Tax=Ornithinimicrobium pratense TaxID=2593973 RepID=A0A5J6V1M2_9MICO|nr:NAD-dependent epimerase/dehydratase family protein [Ornithinimicrobium pratense]QFG67498.1 oxidoreductase [Ornithinimicrobium pratense]
MTHILVLGGTAFLGREVARQAVGAGYDVTCLARGSAPPPEGVDFVVADRDEDDGLATVAGRRWDAVVDVTLHPVHVHRAVRDLRTEHWVFVSTANVYEAGAGLDEGAPLVEPFAGERMSGMEEYGPAKVACEEAYRHSRTTSTLARAGLIGGPGDESGRSGYWPWRFAHPVDAPEGADRGLPEVVTPDDPDYPTALIDVRDLAHWLLRAATQRLDGAYNVTGPSTPLAQVLAAAAEAAGGRARPRPVPPARLAELGVSGWMGPASLPLWIDDPALRGFGTLDTSRAVAAGLVTRPLVETFRDVLPHEEARIGGRRCGLDDADEARVLQAT